MRHISEQELVGRVNFGSFSDYYTIEIMKAGVHYVFVEKETTVDPVR
jgi:hypothetical protein